MKIIYRTETVRQVEYCCKGMEEAEKGKAIVFPAGPGQSFPELKNAWIFGPHSTKLGGAGRPFEINFCPFCGQKIVFEEQTK